jgi:hypothetical protein
MVGRYKLAAPVSKTGPDSNPGREHYSHHPPCHSQVMPKQHGRLLTGSPGPSPGVKANLVAAGMAVRAFAWRVGCPPTILMFR